MKMEGQITELAIVITSLNEVQADSTVPRNVRTKIESVISILKEGTELSININKALNELDGITNDANMQSYTRTQIWNAMSVLEKL